MVLFISLLEDEEGYGGTCHRRGWRRRGVGGFHYSQEKVRYQHYLLGMYEEMPNHSAYNEILSLRSVVGRPLVLVSHKVIKQSWESCLISGLLFY